MRIEIRQFNAKGIEKFTQYLLEMNASEVNDIPQEFLSDTEYSVALSDGLFIEIDTYTSKRELIEYLYPIIKKIRIEDLYYRSGLWTWLALAFFDSLCPLDATDSRTPKEHVKYVLNTGSWNKYYRHLLAAPLRLLDEIQDIELAKMYLSGTPNVLPDFFEQLASRIEIASSKGILEAVKILYWDSNENRPKTGATNKNNPGVLRRLITSILPQFQMTYDLNSMSGEQIVDLLPAEFEGWPDR